MLRVGATTLESFRLFVEEEFMPEDELIATIKGVFTPKPEMYLGQAFGRCLEKGDKYLKPELDGYVVPVRVGNDWREYFFTRAFMDPCREKFDPRGVFEAKAEKYYGDIQVVAKADQIIGTRIVETKAKSWYVNRDGETVASQFHIDKYNDSYQWRFELDLFEGAPWLTYKIFMLGKEPDGEDGFGRPVEGQIVLNDFHQFNEFPYRAMHEDCAHLVREFRRYVQARRLEDVLREKHAQWA